MKKLVIVGASGHGKVIADIAEKNGYQEIVFLDDDATKKECAGFPVVGRISELSNIDGDFIVAIGDSKVREKIQETRTTVSLIHPSAVISRRVTIGEGSVVMAGAVINSDVVLGKACIVNTCASVDHDCVIGDYCHVSVGAHIAGTCDVGNHVWIGAGAIVNNNLSICDNCTIGSGATVVKSIDEAGTYVGVPAKKLY